MNTLRSEKLILTLREVADKLETDVEAVKDFISCGDLIAIGSSKNMVKNIDLYNFTKDETLLIKNEERLLDSFGNQRYPQTHSIKVEDLSNEEWDKMVKDGTKELTPYWNKLRKKWCLALSLGYDENHKRLRKVIIADTQEELWSKYGQFKADGKVLPEEVTEAVIPQNTVKEKKSPKSNMLFEDYLNEYLESKVGYRSSRTFDTKINAARHIVESLGNYRMGDINLLVLNKFISSLPSITYKKGGKKKSLSQSSINKIYDTLHEVIRYASKEEGDRIYIKDLMKDMERPRTKSLNDEIKALTKDEFKRISDIVKENMMISTWVHIMMYTGARPSEILALEFSDIDYERGTIKIRRALSHELKHDISSRKRKGTAQPKIKELKNERNTSKINYQRRELKVSKHVLDIIKSWEDNVKSDTELMKMKCANGTEEFLFHGSKGQPWLYRDYRQVYERLLAKEGLDVREFTPYRFRHTYCTNALRMNIDIKTVQLMMGDNTSDMVLRIYANMNKDDVLRGGEIFSNNMDTILWDDEE